MRKYKIVTILWEDHQHYERSKMVSDPDNAINPTLSVGILYRQTKKYYVLISDIERYDERDDVTYTIIKKPIAAIKEFGEIEVAELRE